MSVVHSEQSVPESPGLAEEIVAAMREPFALLDARLHLLAGSQAFFLRFGLDREWSLGRCVFELGTGEWDTPGSRELFELIAPSRDVVEGYSLEVRGRGTDHPRSHVSVRPIRQGRNEIVFFLVGFSDPPRTGPTPHELIPGQDRRSGELLALLDPRSLEFLRAEGAADELTGHTAAALEGTPIGILLHPDDRRSTIATLSMLTPAEPRRRVTFRVAHRDGRQLWIDALCSRLPEGAGSSAIRVVMRDVSDRRRAEEALRWLGRQTKLILDSAADGIFGVDSAGKITFINPSAARSLGYRVPELLGRSYLTILPAQGAAGPTAAKEDVIALTLTDGVARLVREGSLRCGDGSSFPVELSCSPARDHGQVVGAVVTFRGIAERLRTEAAARRAEWLAGVGETTLAVRHEINNPLTTLLAEARLLEMGGNSPAEEREMIASICADARRIGEVIRRLAERQDDPHVRIEGRHRMLDLSAW